LEFTVNCKRILIATNPEINATKKGPIDSTPIWIGFLTKVNSQAPKIVGIPRSIEKNTASFFLSLRITPVAIVIPDLEIPGSKAILWAIPIKNDFFKSKSSIFS